MKLGALGVLNRYKVSEIFPLFSHGSERRVEEMTKLMSGRESRQPLESTTGKGADEQ